MHFLEIFIFLVLGSTYGRVLDPQHEVRLSEDEYIPQDDHHDDVTNTTNDVGALYRGKIGECNNG